MAAKLMFDLMSLINTLRAAFHGLDKKVMKTTIIQQWQGKMANGLFSLFKHGNDRMAFERV